MAEIILVHGIAQEQRSAADLEVEWIPRLAGGVENAGHQSLADKIRSGEVSIRMAFYGDIFTAPGQQGIGLAALDDDEKQLALEMAYDVLQNAADSPNGKDSGEARRALAALSADVDDTQGVAHATMSKVVALLDRVPWFSRGGLSAASALMPTLAQASRYLHDGRVREYAHSKVVAHLGEETRAIVAHSLGSVVAYDVTRSMSGRLPLLLTLGSPLGLSSVNRHLVPQPTTYPSAVFRWVNVAALDDPVAARTDLHPMFGSQRPSDSALEPTTIVDNGSSPHASDFYLTKPACGTALASSLERRAGQR